jgi:hypothetical protein
MIASTSLRVLGLALATLSGGSLISKCKEKPAPVDAAPVPVETASAIPTSIEAIPVLDDAGTPDADAGDAGKKPTGPYVNPNVARIRTCCNAIANQAKALGSSPEGATLLGLAGSCNGAAAALQSNPNAPELAMFKALMAGKSVPNLCQGL